MGILAQLALVSSHFVVAQIRTRSTELSFEDARMIQVRHRSHATYSRQPRQIRKEATVRGPSRVPGTTWPPSWSYILRVKKPQLAAFFIRRLAGRRLPAGQRGRSTLNANLTRL